MLRSNNNYNEVLPHREEGSGLLQDAYKIDTKFLGQVVLDSSIEGLLSDIDRSDSLAAISEIYNRLCSILCYDQILCGKNGYGSWYRRTLLCHGL